MCGSGVSTRHPAFHKRAARPTGCCKNLHSGESRVLPLLAALAWDQIAVRSAFFEDETKRIGINTGQAEDEKARLRMKKPGKRGDFLETNYMS